MRFTHHTCVWAVRGADGKLAVVARLDAKPTYFWGAAWYTDLCYTKPNGAVVGPHYSGIMLLAEGTYTAPAKDQHPIDPGNCATGKYTMTTRWDVEPGKVYRVQLFRVVKDGGYWDTAKRDDSTVRLSHDPINITVP